MHIDTFPLEKKYLYLPLICRNKNGIHNIYQKIENLVSINK